MKALFKSLLAVAIVGAGNAVAAANQVENKAPPSDRAASARSAGAATQTTRESGPSEPGKTPPIDINSAGQKALEEHPMIGPFAARAILAARPFASLDDLNRLQGLSPERIEQIRGAATVSAPAAESPAPDRTGPEHGKVDVNTADRATLEAIPAIGPDLAPAIIAARPFARIDDLDRIQGISAERLELVRNALTVGTPELATRKKPAASRPKQDELEPTGRAKSAPRR